MKFCFIKKITLFYLQAQQELESRMKEMLEKVAELQSSKLKPTSVEDDRVKELERQVAALTEHRIQHLEKLQEHQVEMQVYTQTNFIIIGLI